MKYVTLCVLNDGTTYTDVNGCKLILVTEEDCIEVIDQGGDADDLSPLAIVDLSSLNIEYR